MISVTWQNLKSIASSNLLPLQFSENNSGYTIYVVNGTILFSCYLEKSDPANVDQIDFETNYKTLANGVILNQYLPFASKKTSNGKKLFRRKHGYTLNLVANSNSTLEVTNPYAYSKINEVEILWCPEGVMVDMEILDSVTGTYTTIPKKMLSKYGHSVAIAKDEFKDTSPYDADLLQNMIVKLTFINTSAVEKTVAVNIIFHEVV